MQVIIFIAVQQLLSVSEAKEWLHDSSGCGGFPGFVLKNESSDTCYTKEKFIHSRVLKSMNELNKTPLFEKTLGEFDNIENAAVPRKCHYMIVSSP